MEHNEVTEARISALETRITVLEQRQSVLEQGGSSKRRRRELTPEERKAIRARLVAGQERKRREREAGDEG